MTSAEDAPFPALAMEPEAPGEGPAMAHVVQRLTQFWVEQGCLLLLPCDFAIPAGSMHPDIFFNLLHDRPWSSALTQPVRRPLDGRWGLHPYRLARHLEFHVLLRDRVDTMQDLYVDSLRAIGFDLTRHDLCFSDGPWESHSLAAWGSGWHVQLDGLGVARLTFLRHLAGRPLDSPAVELVYGIERMALVWAGVPGLDALPWGDRTESGEPWRSGEDELSRYAFEVADASSWQQALERRENEARRCLEAGLPRTAYELAVGNLEHVDLLLARGQLEIRDRLRHLQRVRDLVVAAARVARQEEGPVPSTDSDPTSPTIAGTRSPERSVVREQPTVAETVTPAQDATSRQDAAPPRKTVTAPTVAPEGASATTEEREAGASVKETAPEKSTSAKTSAQAKKATSAKKVTSAKKATPARKASSTKKPTATKKPTPRKRATVPKKPASKGRAVGGRKTNATGEGEDS